jgi:hypothetical protein
MKCRPSGLPETADHQVPPTRQAYAYALVCVTIAAECRCGMPFPAMPAATSRRSSTLHGRSPASFSKRGIDTSRTTGQQGDCKYLLSGAAAHEPSTGHSVLCVSASVRTAFVKICCVGQRLRTDACSLAALHDALCRVPARAWARWTLPTERRIDGGRLFRADWRDVGYVTRRVRWSVRFGASLSRSC